MKALSFEVLQNTFKGLEIVYNHFTDKFMVGLNYKDTWLAYHIYYHEMIQMDLAKGISLIKSMYRDIDCYLNTLWC